MEIRSAGTVWRGSPREMPQGSVPGEKDRSGSHRKRIGLRKRVQMGRMLKAFA